MDWHIRFYMQTALAHCIEMTGVRDLCPIGEPYIIQHPLDVAPQRLSSSRNTSLVSILVYCTFLCDPLQDVATCRVDSGMPCRKARTLLCFASDDVQAPIHVIGLKEKACKRARQWCSVSCKA